MKRTLHGITLAAVLVLATCATPALGEGPGPPPEGPGPPPIHAPGPIPVPKLLPLNTLM